MIGTSAGNARNMTSARNLGVLLRIAHQQFARYSYAAAETAGYLGLRPSHTAAVLRPLFSAPRGLTAVELAARARITKQVIGRMVHDLQAQGYVARGPHPTDGRARIVRMTEKGRKAFGAIRASSLQLEAACGQRLGTGRMKVLHELLRDLERVLVELEADTPDAANAAKPALTLPRARSRRVTSSRTGKSTRI